MAWVVVALVLFAVGMDYLGFCLGTALFLGFLLKAVDPQRWTTVCAVAILGAAITYGVFQYWLNVPLPEGFWGF